MDNHIVEILDDGSAEVLVNPNPVTEIDVITQPVVEIEVLQGWNIFNGVPADTGHTAEYQIATGVIENDPTNYREFLPDVNGNLGTINIYADSTKAALLMTKTFAYDGGGNLSTITVVFDGATVVKTFGYSGGDLFSINGVAV